VSAKKNAVSSLRKQLIESAPKPLASRAWWGKFSSAELEEMKELCREREIEGSEINTLYRSRTSLARFFIKAIAPSMSVRTVLEFIESSCRE